MSKKNTDETVKNGANEEQIKEDINNTENEDVNDNQSSENTDGKETSDESENSSEDLEKDEASKDENNEQPSKPEESEEAKYARLMADFQNYKRRTEKEKSDIHAYANEKIVTKLLDVMDNFERALEHKPDEDGKFHEGMEMIFTQLKTVLEENGVEEINALEEEFDPNFHNAVMMEDAGEDKKDKVTGVLQKGYKLKGKVVRPSVVKVGQ